jgi:hypothetical protein
MSADPVRQESPGKPADSKSEIEERLKQFQIKDYWQQRRALHDFYIRQRKISAVFPFVVFASPLVLALYLALWFFLNLNVTGGPKGTDVATAIAALVAFAFGYQQWRSARHEKAMEDFYSRLTLANQKREGAKLVSLLLKHPWELKGVNGDPLFLRGYKDHQWSMYVYSELDNLEYVVEKYYLGYMKPRHALRGLRTFYERCLRQCFRDRALQCVRFMGYNESTIKVVEQVCDDIEKWQPPQSQATGSVLKWPLGKAALW